jgi:hypothetical protein
MKRAYLVSQTNYNRRLAAREQLKALRAAVEIADHREKTRLIDLLLDAQRRLADAESRYYQSLAEHALAVTRVHYEKGSLLDYNEIYLAEGPWPGKAYFDACRREHSRGAPKAVTDYRLARVPIVSQGPYAQDTVPAEPQPLPEVTSEENLPTLDSPPPLDEA